MAPHEFMSRLGGWEGYEVLDDWDEVRGQQRGCVIRLSPIRGQLRSCGGCGRATRLIHDVQERRIRDLPVFEHSTELIVPRVRVACLSCGPKLERLPWLAPYARVTTRLAESVARLCRVASIAACGALLRPGLEDGEGSGPRQSGACARPG